MTQDTVVSIAYSLVHLAKENLIRDGSLSVVATLFPSNASPGSNIEFIILDSAVAAGDIGLRKGLETVSARAQEMKSSAVFIITDARGATVLDSVDLEKFYQQGLQASAPPSACHDMVVVYCCGPGFPARALAWEYTPGPVPGFVGKPRLFREEDGRLVTRFNVPPWWQVI